MRARELQSTKPLRLSGNKFTTVDQSWNPHARMHVWGIYDSFNGNITSPRFILEHVLAFAGLNTACSNVDQSLCGRISDRIWKSLNDTIKHQEHRLCNESSSNLLVDAKKLYQECLRSNLTEAAANKRAADILENFQLRSQPITSSIAKLLSQIDGMISKKDISDDTKKTIFSLSIQPVAGLITFRTKTAVCSRADRREFECDNRTYTRTNSLDIANLPDRCFGILRDHQDLSRLFTSILVFSDAKKQTNLKNTLPHETAYTITDTDNSGQRVQWDVVFDFGADILENVAHAQQLDEVVMNPTAFRRFLNSPEARGIRAGFEAELIFRDTQGDADGSHRESEPNWDADERTGGIQDIIDFFTGGDNGISGRTARRLQDQLTESFYDWVQQQFTDDYFDQVRFKEWCDDNIWPKEDDDYRDQARNDLGDEATDEEVEAEAVSLFRDDVERDWDRSGPWYDQARDELYEEYSSDIDEGDWLDEQGLRWMSNVADEYGLDWPYWTDDSYGTGSRDWQEIADGLGRVTGMPVRVSGGYHGAARREGQYIIEPDSSLDADSSEDVGLEVVSPPLPLAETLEQLRRIIDWANGPGDAYTNSSTGIHMGVSLPYKGGDVDPIKLILFMGDKNLLELFGRESNTYARSAYDRLESKIRSMKNAGPKQIEGVMELMKNNLIELADRDLRRGVLGDKYVSVNPHDGYIEFRGPGGDYLAKEDEISGVLENTMLRLAYAMSIAGDNSAYRQEYAKKLYKVLTTGDRDNPFMRLFADYSAGMLSGEELKRQWADTVLAAERGDVEDVPLYTATGEYEVYDRSTGTRGDRDSYKVIDTFPAGSDQEAMDIAMNRWAGKGIDFGVRVKVEEPRTDKPKSRRVELAKRVTRSTRDVGEQLWRVNHHSSTRWIIARSQAEAVEKAIKQDRMFDNPETRARIATDIERQQWQLDQEARALRQRDSEQDAAEIRARLGVAQPAGGEFTGRWLFKNARNGDVLHTISGIGNSQADANRYAREWAQREGVAHIPLEVVPEMR